MKVIKINKNTVTVELNRETFDILTNYHPEPRKLVFDVETQTSRRRDFPLNVIIKAFTK